MAGSSNPLNNISEKIQDLEFLYASNANVSNFVSVKLSSDRNYHLWKTQMLCLMSTHNMRGIVDDAYVSPRASRKEIMYQYDSLLKGWIFGSVSENVLGTVIDLDSAKDVWNKLKSFYDASMSRKQAPTKSDAETKLTKSDGETETKDIDVVSAQTNTNVEDAISINVVSSEPVTQSEDHENKTASDLLENEIKHKNLLETTMRGDWLGAEAVLKKDKDLVKEEISGDGSMMLHVAVGVGHKDFVKNLFSYISEEDVLATRKLDGSTALHIAAIVGNTYAADLLLKKNKRCLRIKDKNGEEPLHKAYENMHLDTIGYLLKAVDEYEKSMSRSFSIGSSVHSHLRPGVEIGVDLLVNAISAKQYNLASDLIVKFPKFASKNDDALMAIAKTFPSGDFGRTIKTFSWKHLWEGICIMAQLLSLIVLRGLLEGEWEPPSLTNMIVCDVILMVPFALLVDVFLFLLGLMLLPSGVLLYLLTWISRSLVEPITHIQKKKEEMDEAEKVLELVCNEIDKLEFTGTHHPYYTRPILEAARQNAHKVVDEILCRSPKAIQSTDKSGYDIIQLAIIHRSERIYNLIYDIGERKNLYRTIVDSSKNNILHLAGRLAPSHVLNHTTGAALQLQRELQWREVHSKSTVNHKQVYIFVFKHHKQVILILQEVKEVVFPTYITQENIFKETPDMVFTREHKNLVKEGEQWMKTTAESCSITAALITTIVFAAAITVPGGSNQETGIPVFTKDIAFIIFCVSDAISLFSSTTALLVFLSILTARFSEKDFLVSLPRRLLIGICSLLLSAISMMVAFSSTLFLVFCHQKIWMLAPICGLSLIPISFFVASKFLLIVDLFQSTYGRKFGPRRRGKRARFNPDKIRLFFGK
ncbi:ankyrin repeat-containing domain, PGG domain, Gag-polypeptide of LTR copia-type [Artemisia annua]|uniref:Ankyrin repeat-containing domain, PGG domain, Gag-polypeptide of LTR copia-type n=1 Tax=Artemisia annua TaxID=35608 RepID=A0A2U1NQ21_ARTAN|nr:ankyrin repeat-containing domain, PGG domain, Gag-polypeptide of LTR copia-type [Artemisia annua]